MVTDLSGMLVAESFITIKVNGGAVPDSGTSVALLGVALLGLAGFRALRRPASA